MRFVIVAILVGFPALDLYVSLRIARWSGVPLWVWLMVSTLVGSVLLRSDRGAFRAHTTAALRGDQPLFRGLLDSGRKMLAAFMFIMPGIISDLVALALLSLPINTGAASTSQVSFTRPR